MSFKNYFVFSKLYFIDDKFQGGIIRIIKPRKMVLMNIYAGQQWRRRLREQTCGHGRGMERVG